MLSLFAARNPFVSIAFSGAKHCFFKSKALLLFGRSVASPRISGIQSVQKVGFLISTYSKN